MQPDLAALVRSSRIVVLALLAGVVAFAAVAIVVGPTTPPPAGAAPAAGPFGAIDSLLLVLGALIIGQLPVLVFMSAGVQSQATRTAARLTDDPRARDIALARLWFNSIIVRAALAEGAGLFGAVVVLLKGETVALAGVAFAAVVLLALLPTRGRLENWLQRVASDAAIMPPREQAPR